MKITPKKVNKFRIRTDTGKTLCEITVTYDPQGELVLITLGKQYDPVFQIGVMTK